jgi:hypothetical protein
MRTTISIYRQLGKWLEGVDAAYAAAHPELLAATSPLTDPVPNNDETPSRSSTTSFASANTSSAAPQPPNNASAQQPLSDTLSFSHPYLPDPSIDVHFRSGVYLGLGMSHLALSMMPGKLLALVELFGYKGDRKLGLELLERAGGWGGETGVVDKGP